MLTAEEILESLKERDTTLCLNHLSASSAKNMYSCPFKQLCKMANMEPCERDSSHIDFGSAVHEFIDYFYSHPEEPLTEDDMLQAVMPVVTSVTKRKVEPTISAFFEWEARHRYRGTPGLVAEEKFRNLVVAPDLPTLTGAVDLYNPKNGHILDWKTGKSDSFFKYGKPYPLDYLIQGMVYKYYEISKGRNVDRIEFYFMPDHKSGYIRPDIDNSWLEAAIRNIMDYINKGIYYRNRTKLCNWCEYKIYC